MLKLNVRIVSFLLFLSTLSTTIVMLSSFTMKPVGETQPRRSAPRFEQVICGYSFAALIASCPPTALLFSPRIFLTRLTRSSSCSSLRSYTESTAQNLASSASSARASSESSKSSTMNLLTKSIVSYREGLSLDFERAAGNRLRLVFTNVDPSDVDRIFAFTINVNESEEYEVEEIMPKVDVEELVEAVNSDNDFGGFVRGVRNAFKSTC